VRLPLALTPRLILCAAIAVLTFVPATAQAAPGFVAQPAMGGAVQVSDVHVAMNAKGDLVAVWLQGPTVDTLRVAAAVRPAGGPFGAVQLINDPTDSNVFTPRVGIDAQGNAFAIWSSSLKAGANSVSYAKAPAGQQFGAPIGIESSSSAPPSNPDIAVSPAGDLLVAWMTTPSSGGGQGAKADIALPGQNLSGKPTTLTTGNPPANGLRVAFGPNRHGAVVVAGSAGSGSVPIPAAVGIATVAPGSGSLTFETSYAPSNGGPYTTPDVAVDGQGRAVAVFRDVNTNAPANAGVYFAVRPAAGGGFGAGATLIAGGATQPHVGIDNAGDAFAIWHASDDHIRAAFRAASAATSAPFGSPGQLDSGGSGVSNPAIGVDSGGRTVAAWEQGGAVHGTTALAGGSFTPEQALSAAGRAATGASVTVGGDGALGWANGGAQQDVGLTAFDDRAPSFTNISSPTSGDVNVPVSFSATAFDVWGPVTVGWNFGDGSNAAGAAVTHTYATAGDYSVTPVATDAALNSFTGPATSIHINPAPPPPRPVLGQTFEVAPLQGQVLVSTQISKTGKLLRERPVVAHGAATLTPPPGYTGFHLLKVGELVPVGSILDASKGTVQVIMSANKPDTRTQVGQISKGAFRANQNRRQALTTLTPLSDVNFRRVCGPGAKVIGVQTARGRANRQLFANVHGHFRTRGRHSTATVRGTEYLVKDTCSGTLTLVRRGSVVVRDLVKHRSLVVRTGHRYLARPKSLRK
jgi:hypothetical protein